MTMRKILVAASAILVAGCEFDTPGPSTLGAGRFIIKGTVTNLAAGAMTNVTIQLQPSGGGPALRTTTSGTGGVYRFAGLPEGFYRVAVVMGDSSRITATGRRDTIYAGPSAESTTVAVLTYDPGRAISGSAIYTRQDTARFTSIAIGGARVRLFLRTAAGPPEVYTQIDSVLTSATGAFRFAVRPASVFRLQIDTTTISAEQRDSIRAFLDGAAVFVDTFRVTNATASTNATSAASNSIAYRAPFQIRARLFKDRNGDGVYRAVATDPDTVVTGVRVWLRRAGSATNLGSGPTTSSTSTGATGNLTMVGATSGTNGLANRTNFTMHVIRWYLPTGCTIARADTTAQGDIPAAVDTVAGVVALNNIPLTCP